MRLACKHLSVRKAGSFCPFQQVKCQTVITVQGMTDKLDPSRGPERVTSNSKQQGRPDPGWLAWITTGVQSREGSLTHPQ